MRRTSYWVGVCTLAVVVATVAASAPPGYGPPRPGTEGNGLSEDEAATLWSRDDDRYITNEAYREAYGENRSAVHDVANATDITFKRPPATAATWTKNDFSDLPVGGEDRSYYPPDAALESGRFIEAAHASIFAVHPSTVVHEAPGETTRYVAPNGTVRGHVDYRVDLPLNVSNPNSTTSWSVAESRVESVTLEQDGDVLANASGDKTPAFRYTNLSGDEPLELSAVIRLEVLRVTLRYGPNGSVNRSTALYEEFVTVSDSLAVTSYDLSATVYQARYPGGDRGVAIFHSRPWHGYTLTRNGSDRVRGVWRYYTARDTDWDRLLVETDRETTETPSPARPVFVHAYPSEIGPRAVPASVGPSLLTVWGPESASPAGTLGPNIAVEVLERPYTPSLGVAVRTRAVTPGGPTVHGVVRGVNASVTNGTDGVQPLQPARLNATVLDRSDDNVTVRFRLTNASSGDPIDLTGSSNRNVPGLPDHRRGVVVVDGAEYETNEAGEFTVAFTEPGVYTARYDPGGWVDHDPAYAPTSTTVRWHPLLTVDGWVSLLTNAFIALLPFGVAIYVGRHAGRLLGFKL